jgi:hypothetical protein
VGYDRKAWLIEPFKGKHVVYCRAKIHTGIGPKCIACLKYKGFMEGKQNI